MKKLVAQTMAVKNLQRRPVRSWCMIFFVFMLAASLFFSSVLVKGMSDNLEKTTNRMGADIIVVPKEHERSMSAALFQGTLSYFTFDKAWVEPIAELEGIKNVSPQLFMKTLAADCCASDVQLIAFDPESDFIVSPWLTDDGVKMPEKGEVIAGSKIEPQSDGTILFFNKPYKVVGQLEQTHTNYDSCVFMTYETAQEIMNSEKWIENFGVTDNVNELVSGLMIRVEDGVDGNEIAREINYRLDDNCPVTAYTASGLMSGAKDVVTSMGNYSSILIALISILVVVALLCIFTITINERTREFGILASLGASSKKLSAIVLTEGVLIGLAGGLIGVVVSSLALLIFGNTISVLLEIPKLNTDPLNLLMLGGKCLLLSMAVSIAASLYSAWKVSKNNLDTLIKGEEM